MPLRTEVNLGPGNIVLDGDPAAPKKGGTALSPILAHVLWPNGCINQDATWYGGRLRPRPHCVTWRPSSSLKQVVAQHDMHLHQYADDRCISASPSVALPLLWTNLQRALVTSMPGCERADYDSTQLRHKSFGLALVS